MNQLPITFRGYKMLKESNTQLVSKYKSHVNVTKIKEYDNYPYKLEDFKEWSLSLDELDNAIDYEADKKRIDELIERENIINSVIVRLKDFAEEDCRVLCVTGNDVGEEILEKCFSASKPTRIYPAKTVRSTVEVYVDESNPYVTWIEYEFTESDTDDDIYEIGYVFCYLHLENPEEYFLKQKLEPTMNKAQKNSSIF